METPAVLRCRGEVPVQEVCDHQSALNFLIRPHTFSLRVIRGRRCLGPPANKKKGGLLRDAPAINQCDQSAEGRWGGGGGGGVKSTGSSSALLPLTHVWATVVDAVCCCWWWWWTWGDEHLAWLIPRAQLHLGYNCMMWILEKKKTSFYFACAGYVMSTNIYLITSVAFFFLKVIQINHAKSWNVSFNGLKQEVDLL